MKSAYMIEMENFEALFRSLEPEQKNEFLLQQLRADEQLRNTFLHVFRNAYSELRHRNMPAFQKDELLAQTVERADQLRRTIEAVDFGDLDWESYRSPGYYVPDYEVAAEMAEALADDLLNPWLSGLKTTMELGSFAEIMADMAALWAAVNLSNLNDPNESLGSGEYFMDQISQTFRSQQSMMLNRQFTELELQQGFELLLAANNRFFLTTNELLKLMEAFIIQLLDCKQKAVNFYQAIANTHTDIRTLPKLGLHLSLMMGDEGLRNEVLKTGFGHEFETSLMWLDELYAKGSDEFHPNAVLFYTDFGARASDYLRDKVTKGSLLHLEILKNCVTTKSDYEAYRELKTWLNNEEQMALIKAMYSPNQEARFYGLDKNFEQLERLILTQLKTFHPLFSFDFGTALKYFVPENNEMAWGLAKQIIYFKMKSERSRTTYAMMAGILADALKYKAFDSEVSGLILQLYTQRPNLPALKDEFRKAGLIR